MRKLSGICNAAALQAGKATSAIGLVGLLGRLVKIIRDYFPWATIRVRLELGLAQFCTISESWNMEPPRPMMQ